MKISNLQNSFLVLPKTKDCLQSIEVHLSLLSQALSILDLLSNYPNIDSIQLKYKAADVDNEADVIKEGVNRFCFQHGLIRSLTFAAIK